MVIKLNPHHCWFHERRDDEQCSQLQGSIYHFLSEVGEVVFIGPSDFFNQTVHSETLEHSGDLMPRFADHNGAKGAVLKSTDIELSPDDTFEQLEIFTIKEVKPAICALAIRRGFRDLFEVPDPHGGIFDCGDELQVASIRCFHQFPKDRETVDGFLQRGVLHFPTPIPVFHLPVVFEKTDIIDRRLNAQDHREFVIHLDGDGSHVVLDSSPFDTSVEIVANFSLIGAVELPSQKGRYLLGLYGMDRCTGHRFIKRTKIGLVPEDHIRGKLCLHQRPMITRWELLDHRTECSCDLIQSPMEAFYLEGFGQCLSFREILDLDKSVLHQTIGHPLLGEQGGQWVMSVEIELQTEGSPSRHPQITQPQILKNEVKIVVDALGFRPSEEGLARLLVMPGLERRTGFQGGEDMDQPGMIPALRYNLFDPFLFAEILFSDKFDLQTILLGQALRMEADFIPQRFHKSRIVKNTNALRPQMATHGIGVADLGNCPRYYDTVKTGKNPSNLTGIFFCQQSHGFPLEGFVEG